MTQAAPTIMVYEQATLAIKKIMDDYNSGLILDVGELNTRIGDLLTRFEEGLGQPMFQYTPLVEMEPPVAAKMNGIMANLENDLNILQKQLDILRAATLFSHRLNTVEIERFKRENSRVNGKLKTLQLYGDSSDSSLAIFGGTFATPDLFDPSLVPDTERATVVGNEILSLGQTGELVNLTKGSSVKILTEVSNGFPGNNHTILDPAQAPKDPTTQQPIYTFFAERNGRKADLQPILDARPDTWFEYESNQVSAADRLKAKNFNFIYKDTTNNKDIDWAAGPTGGILKLSLEFDLGSVKKVNFISYTPYGLEDNSNPPVRVRQIQISPDRTTWITVQPEDQLVATNASLTTIRAGANVVIGGAVWAFEESYARYVRVHLEQSTPVNAALGHLYYLNASKERVVGPVPPIGNPTLHYSPSSSASGGLIQRREYFQGKRWMIGIRDLVVQQINYQLTSSIVTQPLHVGGIVDRVALEADIYVPPSWPTTDSWVQFFISPDEGSNWFEISRIQDDQYQVPEIIAFNDPTPLAFREPGVGYYNVDNAVTSLRLKITLKRPSNIPFSTPLVRSYKLKVRRQ